MQTLTFTKKLSRQRSFLSSLLPLFAIFLGLGASHKALGQAAYSSNTITISASTTSTPPSSSTIYVGKGSGTPKFDNAVLGGTGAQFDQAAGASTLQLTAAAATILAFPNTTVQSSNLEYRVYPVGTAAALLPNYSIFPLGSSTSSMNGGITTYDFNSTGTPSVDLLNQPTVLGGGSYVVEVRFSSVTNENGTPGTATDPSTTYKATFNVKAPLTTPTGGTTTWQGTSGSRDWRLATNWSNGVPTATSNAIIPVPTTATTLEPLLDDPTYPYAVNNLTLVGQSNSSRGEVEIQQATLTIYGNLRQNAGGLLGTITGIQGVQNAILNSTLIFAGADQVITGRLQVPDIIIRGTGTKSVTGVMLPTNTLSFQPTNPAAGVIVQSAFEDASSGTLTPFFDTTLLALVDFGITGIINPLSPETNVSYIMGVSRSIRALVAGVQNTFGNIGLDLTANYSVLNATVFRIVGDPLRSPTSTAGAVKVPIKRQYIVSNTLDGDDPRFTGAAFTSVVFHYLNSANELNGIPEANLSMFRATSSGPPYQPIYGTLNMGAKTVTRAALNSLPNFVLTLGDRLNPLPVTLAAFDAKRTGTDALVTWETVSEKNSKGFDVQVSANGTEFRTLGFVSSVAANSVSRQSYSFIDKEANKVGTRYYRLHQVDLNGEETFYSPVAVKFDGKEAVAATNLVAYPNPFSGNDNVRVALQSATTGTGKLIVTDMTGRTIRQQNVELTNGLTDVSVAGLGDLKSGLYMVKLTLPSGEVKNLKLQKQ